MRIVYMAAGAAGMYCGACARDTALARGLTARGHEVQFLSLYTPVKSDSPPPGACRVFYGGVNVYLEQHSALFRHTPALLDRLFDSTWLLDFVGRFGIDTAPEDLGEMTVSVLRGPDGRQKKELNKLVDFLTEGPRPDVVHLTNSLLSAIAPAVKDALDVAVVCGLQGEDAFVERIGEPWREEALRLMRRHAGAVDLFVAPGEAYADDMAGLLSTERSRIRVVRAGIDLAPFEAPVERPREVFRIGYLSRIVPEKGLDLLCEAFRLLEEEQPGRCELAIAGEATGTNRAFRDAQLKRLAEAGLDERVEYVGAPDLAGKVGFLKRCSTFSLPSRVGERQAVASLEAQACGVPVVVPDLGIHREVLLLTGGGVLVRPNDARALADALATLRDDEPRARALGERAAAGVREHFSSNAMVEKTLGLYREVSHA